MIVHAAKIALAPLLYMQARRMHATTSELPEPEGERSGIAGDHEGRPIRVLVAGDSSAVGVGARTQREGFAFSIATQLATRLSRPVRWQLVARASLTSEGVFKTLRDGRVEPADLAVVALGVNDITNEVSLARALRYRARIAAWLRRYAQVGHVIFPGVPEIERFPAIPQPLAWYAGLHARRNNRAQARWARRRHFIHHVEINGFVTREKMARDGYHPSAELYASVAARLVEFMSTLQSDPVAH